jgi:hypothetical protein
VAYIGAKLTPLRALWEPLNAQIAAADTRLAQVAHGALRHRLLAGHKEPALMDKANDVHLALMHLIH